MVRLLRACAGFAVGAAGRRQIDIADEGIAEAAIFEASHQWSDHHPDNGAVATDLPKDLVQGLDVPPLVDLIATQSVLNIKVGSLNGQLVESGRLDCLRLVCCKIGIEVTEIDR